MAICTSQHQHQHRHCKKFIFAFRNCFEKIEYLCIFWFLVMTSVPLCCKYLFLYDLYSICTIQPFKGVHWCYRKRLFELSEASVYWYCDKIVAPKVSAYFPAKHPGWSSFQVCLQAFLGLSQKALQSSYSVENLLSPASVKQNSTVHVISRIFKIFKSMQGKVGGCNLKACKLL